MLTLLWNYGPSLLISKSNEYFKFISLGIGQSLGSPECKVYPLVKKGIAAKYEFMPARSASHKDNSVLLPTCIFSSQAISLYS